MEFVFNLFLWGIAGALSLALLGAVFGALVRVAALLNGKAWEKTLGQAIGNGFVSGGLFLAAIGLLVGGLIGYHDPELGLGLAFLAALAAAVLSLMILASLFAGLAYFCTWLGVRGTGLLLALGIGLAVAGIEANRAGVDNALIRLLQTAFALAGGALVLWFRLRSPYKEHAFEPVLNEPGNDPQGIEYRSLGYFPRNIDDADHP
jgi:hypothetical protein